MGFFHLFLGWTLGMLLLSAQAPPPPPVPAQPPAPAPAPTSPQAPPVRHDSVEVHDTAPAAPEAAFTAADVKPAEVKDLPSRPATVADALPLLPGITRSPTGGLRINGAGEQRSAMVVNQADVTDPATGAFGSSVPVDSVETMNVLRTPFLAQYGRFSSAVVSVETKRGGDRWHAEMNDPFPDFRFRSWKMRGLQDTSPRLVFDGPLIPGRLYFAQTVLYDLQKTPVRTLPFPSNTSKRESVNSFSQLDWILSPKQFLTATFQVTPQHANFVNLDAFNPEPVTPSYRQQNYLGAATDHFALGRGMLDSGISVQRFDAGVAAQGMDLMVLQPQGNSGSYFSGQQREAGRLEWRETWSPAGLDAYGNHDLKLGTVLTHTSDIGSSIARPIQVEDYWGLPLQRIDFTGGGTYSHYDVESTVFAQDHWTPAHKVGLDLGMRLERQSISESFRIAPRAGISWAPFSSERTVLRAGYGVFYDRVPLGVYAFDRMPQRAVTAFGPDGLPLAPPVTYLNLTGYAATANTLLIHTENQPGNFAPHSGTWNAMVEHTFSSALRIRAGYTASSSAGLVVLDPRVLADGTHALSLTGTGRATYRAAEITARLRWSRGQFFLGYTRSRSQGDLNDFSAYLGNYPLPLVRPDVYSTTAADLPNRFLAWGTLRLPWKLQILPIVEYRNGIPYTQYDALGNYVGLPNANRFPDFFSADGRVMKDFQVSLKYTLRFSVSCANMTNHFNALAVHYNVADPSNGVFFGNNQRRFRADFDIVF